MLDEWLYRWGLCYWAAAQAQLGHVDEARPAAQQFVTNFQAEFRARGEPIPEASDLIRFEVDFFRRQSDTNHLIEGLQKAGLSV